MCPQEQEEALLDYEEDEEADKGEEESKEAAKCVSRPRKCSMTVHSLCPGRNSGTGGVSC